MVDPAWDRLAAWRDRQMGEDGDLWHRAIIDPVLLDVLGPVRGLRVLDLACGNGYLTRRFARDGAARSVGVDRSTRTLAFARRRERRLSTGAEFRQADSAHLVRFADGSFDRVVANMALMDLPDLDRTVREVGRVLAPDGHFVFSIGHPCFDLDDRSLWEIERRPYENPGTVWRKVSRYQEERVGRAPWRLPDGSFVYTRSYHRTLATYVRCLRAAGLALVRLEEPRPLPEAVAGSTQGPFLLDVPLHLVGEAVAGRVPGVDRLRSGSRTSGRSPSRGSPRSGSARRRRGSSSARPGSSPGS